MPDEIKELRRMLDYTMRRYNELLERVEKLEKQNYITYTSWPTTYCTSVSNNTMGYRIWEDWNLYINTING